uniref:signal peptide peptidase-like 2B isoform X2 n=1 Tax=Myxine glutinosa TaxID=7769 RepID=UPI00358FD349
MAAMSAHLIVIALCLCKQVTADMAFLHAEPSGKEYCIQYNPEWARLPRELSKAGRWPVQDLGPATLCGSWDVPEEGMAGAIVLATRGNCSFFRKAWLAHQYGATALLVVSRLPLGINLCAVPEMDVTPDMLSGAPHQWHSYASSSDPYQQPRATHKMKRRTHSSHRFLRPRTSLLPLFVPYSLRLHAIEFPSTRPQTLTLLMPCSCLLFCTVGMTFLTSPSFCSSSCNNVNFCKGGGFKHAKAPSRAEDHWKSFFFTLFRQVSPRGNNSQYEEVGIPVALMRLEDAQEMRQVKNMSLNLRASLFAPPESIVDYNLLLLFLIAVLIVSLAGIFSRPPPITRLTAGSVLEEEDMRDQALKMSTVTIGVFVVTSCLMLLLLYYLYDYVVYVIIAVFCIASAFSLYHCLCPLLSCIPYGQCNWAWILQDLLCAAFCLCLLLVLHMPSFKACTLLFCCLFLYDIFFVFITPFITRGGESIMVEVATGPSTAVTREKLPMVIKAPRLSPTPLAVCDRPFSLIGLGDILVPGLLVTYCRRFDLYIGQTSIPMYFPCCTLAYGLGLFFSLLALVLTEKGQPALLYLVPCMLLTCTALAALRGHMCMFWNGPGSQHDVGMGDGRYMEREEADGATGQDNPRESPPTSRPSTPRVDSDSGVHKEEPSGPPKLEA